MHRLSLVVANSGYSAVVMHKFLVVVDSLVVAASLVVAHGLQVHELSCLASYEIFQTGDQTCVLCIGRCILNHWITREIPYYTIHCLICKFSDHDGQIISRN